MYCHAPCLVGSVGACVCVIAGWRPGAWESDTSSRRCHINQQSSVCYQDPALTRFFLSPALHRCPILTPFHHLHNIPLTFHQPVGFCFCLFRHYSSSSMLHTGSYSTLFLTSYLNKIILCHVTCVNSL